MATEQFQKTERLRAWRWSQLTLRGLLIATLIIAIFLGYRTNIARREKPSLDLLLEHGCSPRYRHDIFGNLPAIAPRSVREAIGVEHFGSVVRLNFADGYPRSDEAFSMLDRLPNVTVVNTHGASITDVGIAPIACLTRLNCLRLNNANNVTNRGIKNLSSLTELNLLDLSGTGITDQGLSDLRTLDQLEILGLDNTRVSDRGIMELRGLKRLRLLKLQGTKVTSKGVTLLQNEIPNCQIVFGD